MAWHEHIYEMSGNPFLSSFASLFHSVYHTYFTSITQNEVVKLDLHQAIVDAILNSDALGALLACRIVERPTPRKSITRIWHERKKGAACWPAVDRGDAFFMQALDATILNTALPAIAHSLNRSPLAMQSAIISYTLTVAMLIPVSGWLADRFGTRRVFIIAVSLFTLGSPPVFSPYSSLTELVIFRVIQDRWAMMMPRRGWPCRVPTPRSELLPVVLNFVTMPDWWGRFWARYWRVFVTWPAGIGFS